MVRGAGHLLTTCVTACGVLATPAARGQTATVVSGVTPANTSVTAPGAPDPSPVYIPDVSRFVPAADNPESLSTTLQIVVLMTLLTVLPSIVLMMTCFTRMVVVLVLLRQALGTQSLPPSQVVVGLAFFLTLLVMAPTIESVRGDAVQPYIDGRIGQMDAIAVAAGHLRSFMFDQIEAADNESDVYMLVEYARQAPIGPDETLERADVPMTALVPAFILSELKTAFIIGFRIYLPFLVIDMVIATVLVSMGMMMLPPVLISLPFKLLLFVLANGWHLIAGSLASSVV